MNHWHKSCKLIIRNQYSVSEKQHSITKHNIAILACINIFSHSYSAPCALVKECTLSNNQNRRQVESAFSFTRAHTDQTAYSRLINQTLCRIKPNFSCRSLIEPCKFPFCIKLQKSWRVWVNLPYLTSWNLQCDLHSAHRDVDAETTYCAALTQSTITWGIPGVCLVTCL